MKETDILYQPLSKDNINGHPYSDFEQTTRIDEFNITLKCYSYKVPLNKTDLYQSLYYEVNEDGFIMYYSEKLLYYDIPHSMHGARDIEPKFIETWTKIKRYPNNYPQMTLSSTGRRDIYLRESNGNLTKKITKHNGTIQIMYGSECVINLSEAQISLKKSI